MPLNSIRSCGSLLEGEGFIMLVEHGKIGIGVYPDKLYFIILVGIHNLAVKVPQKKFLYAAIIMLVLLMSVQGIYYVVFDMAQVHFKTESGKCISENKTLGVITLSLKAFSRRQDKDEIWVNGALYDVSRYRIAGDSVHVTVYHDKDEEGWIENLSSIFEGNDSQFTPFHGNHFSKVHSNGFNDCKILPRTYAYAQSLYLYTRNTAIGSYCFRYLNGHTSIFSPPPETVNS